MTPNGTLSPMGMMPRPRRLRVVGIFSLGLYQYDNGYGFVTLDVAKRLFNKDRVGADGASHRRHLRVPRDRRGGLGPAGTGLSDGGLVAVKPVALLGALAREDGHLHHDRPDRHGGSAQHRRVAHPARDGEEPGHRHLEDDGRRGIEYQEDLHVARVRSLVRSGRRSAVSGVTRLQRFYIATRSSASTRRSTTSPTCPSSSRRWTSRSWS